MAELTAKQYRWSYKWGGSGTLRSYGSSNSSTAGSGTGMGQSILNSSSGVKNPTWRTQVKRHQNATTAFNATYTTGDATWCTIEWHSFYSNATGSVYQGYDFEVGAMLHYPNISSLPSVPGAVSTRVTNRCIQKFNALSDQIRSSVELGQDLGEYKETLESIHRPLSSMRDKIFDYLHQLGKLKRKIKNPPSLAKALADTYLEWRFGINPLVSDVAQLIADAGRYRFPLYPFSVTSGEEYAVSLGTQQVNPSQQWSGMAFDGLGLVPTWNTRSSSAYSVRYKGELYSGCNVKTGQISRAQAWELTPKDWLPTAWDLLPYSWIADYFVNVGDMIRGLCSCFSDVAWGCKTVRTTGKLDYSPITITPLVINPSFHWVYKNHIALGGNASWVTRNVQRSPLVSSDLMPRFQIRVPVSKYPYYNMGALVLSRAKQLVPLF